MKAQLVKTLIATPHTDPLLVRGPVTREHPYGTVPAGTELDGTDVRPWWYVQMGAAVPLDDECRMAAGMTDGEIDIQVQLYEAKRAGIQPEDMAAWRAGAMTGYDEEGEWIPGPKYTDWLAKHSNIILPGGNDDDDE